MTEGTPRASREFFHDHVEPLSSAASRLSQAFAKVDLAKRVDENKTVDPALDPKNQHVHNHHIYVDPGVGGRVDPAKPPHHEHAGEHSGELAKIDPEKHAHVHEEGLSSQGSGEVRSTVVEDHTAWTRLKMYLHRYKWAIYLFFGLFFTSWWLSIVIQKKTRHRWLIPTVLWILLMARFITLYVRTRPLLEAANWVWQRTFVKVRNMIPRWLWAPIEGVVLLAVVLLATFVTPQVSEASRREDRAVSFFGYVVMYFGFFLFSRSKRNIRWHTIFCAMLLQFIFALFVLRTKAGYDFFNWIAFLASKLLSFSHAGMAFLFSDEFITSHPFFIFTGIPSIVFFIAFIHIWYYWGILQWLVGKFAVMFFWLLQVSGAEAVVCAATPFVGQGESAILVKPFIKHMTDAEIFQILVSGFATVSGSMFASYIALGLNAQALITSCIMSIPASIASAKLVIPETDTPLTTDKCVIPEDAEAEEVYNVFHAFSNGAWLGLTVALSIITNILCIIALVAMIDAILTWFGQFWGIPELTLAQILGYIFYPVSFLLGVSRDGDIYKVAKLLGIKLIQNEYVAYTMLYTDPEYANLSPRSNMLATYGLCGFSNLGSVGIQIGVLGQLCPERKGTVVKYAILALFIGCFTTFTSAAVAGMVMDKLDRYTSDGFSS